MQVIVCEDLGIPPTRNMCSGVEGATKWKPTRLAGGIWFPYTYDTLVLGHGIATFKRLVDAPFVSVSAIVLSKSSALSVFCVIFWEDSDPRLQNAWK